MIATPTYINPLPDELKINSGSSGDFLFETADSLEKFLLEIRGL